MNWLTRSRELMRHGYDVRILAAQFNAKPVEIRHFLQGAPKLR
jgi:hypothetical protein